jgi:RNA polymerase sigma factor (sigma-70 family)
VVTTATTAATTAEAATGRQGLSPSTDRLDVEAVGAYVGGLFAEHGRMVLGLCRLLLRDPIEAEDAAQQAFLSAHQALLGGSVPRDAAAWIGAIARNECRARIHARMREPLTLPDLPSDLPDPLAAAIRAADLEAVWAALGALPRRQRRALLLRELGGLSYHELGRALGVSHSAVESLLFRARRRVRSLAFGANVAVTPIALRDQLGQLIPGFDPASAGIVARIAALPVAWKLAGAAVSVGVVATGASGLHPRTHAATQPRAHGTSSALPAPAVASQAHGRRAVRAPAVESRVVAERHRRNDPEVEVEDEAEHTAPAPHVDEHGEPSAEPVQTSSEGPGPGPTVVAEPAQLEQAHDGPGDGGQTRMTDDHSGSDGASHDGGGTSGSDGGSDHSGPG